MDISADSDGTVDSLGSNSNQGWVGVNIILGDSYWEIGSGSPAHCSPWTGFPWLSRRALSPGSIEQVIILHPDFCLAPSAQYMVRTWQQVNKYFTNLLLSDQIYRTCTWFSESCLHSISCSIQPSSSVMFFFSSVMVAIFHFCNYST